MQGRSLKDGADRYGKRKSRTRPDRIIEKKQNWQDYLDPDEDPGLIDDNEDGADRNGDEAGGSQGAETGMGDKEGGENPEGR